MDGGGVRSIEATDVLSNVVMGAREARREERARVRFWFSVMYAIAD